MNKNSLSLKSHDADVIEISLHDLIVIIWNYRWMVCTIFVLVMFSGLSGTFYFAKYRSEGFFQFGGDIPVVDAKDKEKSRERGTGITLSDYKRYAASFMTGERFIEYVKDKQLDSLPGMEGLRKTFILRSGIENLIQPVYPFTKLDAKLLGDQPKDSSNDVIGLQIEAENADPLKAQVMAGFLGRYVMDSIIYLIYSDALRFKHSEILAQVVKLDNIIILNKENLEEYRRKSADLKQTLSRYPSSTSNQPQQIISVDADSARYLSPMTQLVTTEVQSSEANEMILKARREQKQALILAQYYTQAEALLNSTKSGETVLRQLEDVKNRVFKSKNLEDESIKAMYNMITIDNQNAINVYLEKSRFIAGPTFPAKSSARPLLALLLSLVLGLFLSVLLVGVRTWWRKHQIKLVN